MFGKKRKEESDHRLAMLRRIQTIDDDVFHQGFRVARLADKLNKVFEEARQDNELLNLTLSRILDWMNAIEQHLGVRIEEYAESGVRVIEEAPEDGANKEEGATDED